MDDAVDRAPWFCDISLKVLVGAPVGILCANICILRFLARILQPNAGNYTKHERTRSAIFDYVFCLVLPVFLMATQILYQPARYGISKTIGCTSVTVLCWPLYVCLLIWAPLISFTGCLLSGASPLALLSRLPAETPRAQSLSSTASTATVATSAAWCRAPARR
jgi:pheromone a factor receptor